jgi:hypothetical protein
MVCFKSILIASIFGVCILCSPQYLQAQDFFATELFTTDEQFELYESQLNAILKTRRDEEKLFVKKIVEQLKLKRLSSKLVNTSFDWARHKRPGTKYPFVYFERVLRFQATRLGIGDRIPPFDYEIYSKSTPRSSPK